MSTNETLLDEVASEISSEERRFYRKADDVAARIRALMERHGYSQSELADRMGRTDSYVSRVLSGGVNLTLKTLSAFEEALQDEVLALPEPRERGPRRPTPGPYKTQTFARTPRRRATGVCVSGAGDLLTWRTEEVNVSREGSSPAHSGGEASGQEGAVANAEEMLEAA